MKFGQFLDLKAKWDDLHRKLNFIQNRMDGSFMHQDSSEYDRLSVKKEEIIAQIKELESTEL